MARYRAIHQQIWRDEDFFNYSQEQKLLFIYLISNSSTTESGIYKLNLRIVSFETSLPVEQITSSLASLKNVLFDQDSKAVFIRKFRIYNAGGNPEKIKKSIENDVRTNPVRKLWIEFTKQYPEFKELVVNVFQNSASTTNGTNKS